MLSLSALLKSGFTPTLKDFNKCLIFLYETRKFKSVIHLFSQLVLNNVNADSQTQSLFAKALLKEHKYEEAAEFLKTLGGKSDIFCKNRIFDALVQGFCNYRKDPERALFLLKDILENYEFVPSSRTFISLVYSFSKIGKIDEAVDLIGLKCGQKLKYPFDNYICSSVISGFVRIGKPELAVQFYDTAIKSGSLRPNTVTCTAVVNAYCRLGHLDKVSDMVSWMENNDLGLDLVFYSSWIYGLFSEGLLSEALKKFGVMVERKYELDLVSCTILIDGFSKNGEVEKAVGILHKMRTDGLDPNLVTYTAIMLGFCKKGNLKNALAVFGLLKTSGIKADEFTYAILINGVCKQGDFDLVFQLLDEMEKNVSNPGVVVYNIIINGLCNVGRTKEADDFSKGIVGDVFTYSTLLKGYMQKGSASGISETKRRFEATGVMMDLVMCNVLIKATLMVGLFDDALEIFKGMSQMNLSANAVTYLTLIDGYCKAGRVDDALEIFDEFRRTSNCSPKCYNDIISVLCKKGMIDVALDVFGEYVKKGLPLDRKTHMLLLEATLTERGVEGLLNFIYRLEHIGFPALRAICYDALSYICKMGFPEASYNILLVMKANGISPTSICYYSILRALLCDGKRLLAKMILPWFVKLYGVSEFRVCKTLLHYLCLSDLKKALTFLTALNESKCNITIPVYIFKALTNDGRSLDAYELLVTAENNLPSMDVTEYSIIIDVLCKERHVDKALDICYLATRKGVSMNIVVYNSVINGLCKQGCLVHALRIFDSLEKINVSPSEITYGTIIDALVKEGHLLDARTIFERMKVKNLKPTVHIYNSLINGYCQSNLLQEGLELFKDLEVSNLTPDGFTVSALMNGYCNKGDMEDALKLFFESKSKELLPDFLGFMYLIRGLCAKGRMEESRTILREMLQTKTAIDVLKRIDTEVQSDSVENILLLMCDRGNIYEAVALLEEVGSFIFSDDVRNSSHNKLSPHDLEETIDRLLSSDSGSGFCSTSSPDLENSDNVKQTCSTEAAKTAQLKDFDTVYDIISSLCAKGELEKANKLTRLLIGL